MTWQWGQFVDHDIDLTPTGETAEYFPIAIPTGDPWFDPRWRGNQVMTFFRSEYDFHTGEVTPRQQLNFITSWLDGSQIYGSDDETASSLRTFHDGLLKVSAHPTGDLLPCDEDGFFVSGDVRVNEQVYLTAMHTLFMREHNRQCRELHRVNPALNDDQLFFMARERVIGTLQAITYNEFLPAILGPGAIPPYTGYRPNVFPNIANTFSTVAYRFGHSMLNSELLRLDVYGQTIPAGNLRLANAFFNPDEIHSLGIDPYLMGLTRQLRRMSMPRWSGMFATFCLGRPAPEDSTWRRSISSEDAITAWPISITSVARSDCPGAIVSRI